MKSKLKNMIKHIMSSRKQKYIAYAWYGEAEEQVKSLIMVDMKGYTEGMEIKIYLPDKYEIPLESTDSVVIYNSVQNRNISPVKAWNEGYDCLVNVVNVGSLPHSMDLLLTNELTPSYQIVKK